jgi:hypothetical protein
LGFDVRAFYGGFDALAEKDLSEAPR